MKKFWLILSALMVICCAGLYAQYSLSPDRMLVIRDFKTGKVYVEHPIKVGDKLFFGWIHSWERIRWHEYYHIEANNTLVLDTICFPAFGAGIPENKGKKTRVENGMIYMDDIGQVFEQFDWINSHLATRDIKINDMLLTSGRLLPEHTRLTLKIEKRGLLNGRK